MLQDVIVSVKHQEKNRTTDRITYRSKGRGLYYRYQESKKKHFLLFLTVQTAFTSGKYSDGNRYISGEYSDSSCYSLVWFGLFKENTLTATVISWFI